MLFYSYALLLFCACRHIGWMTILPALHLVLTSCSQVDCTMFIVIAFSFSFSFSQSSNDIYIVCCWNAFSFLKLLPGKARLTTLFSRTRWWFLNQNCFSKIIFGPFGDEPNWKYRALTIEWPSDQSAIPDDFSAPFSVRLSFWATIPGMQVVWYNPNTVPTTMPRNGHLTLRGRSCNGLRSTSVSLL